MEQDFGVTRRSMLLLASAASVQSWSRLYAGDSEFWNKKDVSQWSVEEIGRFKTKSPWAKEITASAPPSNSDYGGRGGGLGGGRVGGLGIPDGGMGGGRGRGGGRGGSAPVQFKGLVRWVSAQPMQQVLKSTLPGAFANHYVISVSGIPINSGRRRSSRGDDGDSGDRDASASNGSGEDALDRAKNLTYLEPKDKPPAQPGVVEQASANTDDPDTFLFGFSRDLLQLSLDDKEVTFTTQLGRVQVKAKFNLKDMRYHDELAL